jgi:hypothetical protein
LSEWTRLLEEVKAGRKRPFSEGMPGYECIEPLFAVLMKMVYAVEDWEKQLHYKGEVEDRKRRFLALLEKCGAENDRLAGIDAVVLIEATVKGLITQYQREARVFGINEVVAAKIARAQAAAESVSAVCADVLVRLRAAQDDARSGEYCRLILERLQTLVVRELRDF